jgi:hypothetical protein
MWWQYPQYVSGHSLKSKQTVWQLLGIYDMSERIWEYKLVVSSVAHLEDDDYNDHHF